MDDKITDQRSEKGMPAPPDLTGLLTRHSQRINTACQQAAEAFSGVKHRDKEIQKLAETLGTEVTEVQTLAAAATTPQLAVAAAQAVKALAVQTFAKAALTSRSAQQSLQSGFK